MAKVSIIDKKITNLVTINSRDSCIFTRKSSKITQINKYIDTDTIDEFFNNYIDSFELSININLREISENLNEKDNLNDFLNYLNEIQYPISANKKNILAKDFYLNKSSVIKQVIDYFSNIKNYFLSFKSKAKSIQRDKGSWNLYICKYFLKGITPSKKQCINAPLLMYKIDITESRDSIMITKNSEFILNEKLLVFLQRDSENFDKKMSDFKNIQSLDELIDVIGEITNINILKEFTNNNDFYAETTSTISSRFNRLVISDELCLGIFEPSGGKLMEELIYLNNNNLHNAVFESDSFISEEQLDDLEINGEPILQIDNLDIYQRKAVRSSLINNTIIHGPPGTGKSEVITNIIANAIYLNKNILMISEKNAALEVLEKRLKSLNIFSLNITGYEDAKSKEKFYESINKIEEIIGNGWIGSESKELNDFYLKELQNKKEELISFRRAIKKINELENIEISGYSFIDFLNLCNRYGGVGYIKYLMTNRIFDYFENRYNELNFSCEKYFNEISKLKMFFDKYYNSNSFDEVAKIMEETHKMRIAMKKINLDNLSTEIIEECTKSYPFIENILSKNYSYNVILKKNPFQFHEDSAIFKKVKKELNGIINDKFFQDFETYKTTISKFLNTYNVAKESHKKYILNKYTKSLEIESKRPFSKTLTRTKLDENDKKIIECLNELNSIDFELYSNFIEIANQDYLFTPLNVIYFFNKSIFKKEYLEYLENKFDIFSYEEYKIFIDNDLCLEKWKKLINSKQLFIQFNDKYSEFLQDKLFNENIKKYSEFKWNFFETLIFQKVKYDIINRLSNLNEQDKILVKEVFRIAKLKRKPAMYKFIQDFFEALKYIFPIWITRPEQCSMFVPFKKGIFDYGIFDEASQMFLERAYSLLFRCQINIVAGDDKQLRPTNFFNSRVDIDDNEDDEMYDLEIQESLLDRSIATNWKNVMLKNHYRSLSKDLIRFSSEFIYDNKLNYATKNGLVNSKRLLTINVDGIFNDGINVEEANEVIRQLENNINNKEFENILIITFNSKQQDFVETRIQEYLSSEDSLYTKKIYEKMEQNKLNIINIENVQGDEADLVIISACYGKKDKLDTKIRANFGPLIKDGGKNRLNVAITRAKRKMIVVKSLYASSINDTPNENLLTFKKFISFLDDVSKESLIDEKYNVDILQFDSDFEREVFDYLKNDIYEKDLFLSTQYEVGNKKIDIVILDQNKEKVLLGIEVDGWKYHHGTQKKFEDIERQRFLEARGYKIFRVLEHEWKYNKNLVKKMILMELNN